nr:amidohydrolase family protein [Paenibacillus caui]
MIYGDLVLPDGILPGGAIGIKDGAIAWIGRRGQEGIEAGRTVDAAGKLVLPGAIDAHVHCYSSLEEGTRTATRSAAAGGVTTIIEMPYDATGMVCTAEMLQEKKERMETEAAVDFALLATIRKEGAFDDIIAMAEAGACGFKVSMFNTDSFRFPRIDDGRLYQAFGVIAETGVPVGVHCETDEIVRLSIAKYESLGRDPRAHCWSRPKVAEATAANTVMQLALHTGAKLHLYHCTFPEIFEAVHHYTDRGANITAETCTHYLLFHEEDMLRLGPKGKINPPLRQAGDVEGLWRLMAEGKIDMVTSDHAPWKLDRKSDPDIFRNSSGAPGVETLLPILFSEGVASGRIPITELVKLVSEKPAERFGLGSRKGKLRVGLDADIVIMDPNASGTLDEAKQHSSAGWSLYHGMNLQGRIEQTYVRGQLVYDGEQVQEGEFGRFVQPNHL